MADNYYDALIAKWATAPAGTTDEKLVWINAEVIKGAIPASFYTQGDKLLNCIDWAEFTVLPAEHQNNMIALCSVPGQLLGGYANTAFIVDGMFMTYFPLNGATIANLTKLAQAEETPWWQATVEEGGGGLSSPVSHSDLDAAGLS